MRGDGMSPLIFLQLCRGYCLVLALFNISSMKLNIILGEKNDRWSAINEDCKGRNVLTTFLQCEP